LFSGIASNYTAQTTTAELEVLTTWFISHGISQEKAIEKAVAQLEADRRHYKVISAQNLLPEEFFSGELPLSASIGLCLEKLFDQCFSPKRSEFQSHSKQN